MQKIKFQHKFYSRGIKQHNLKTFQLGCLNLEIFDEFFSFKSCQSLCEMTYTLRPDLFIHSDLLLLRAAGSLRNLFLSCCFVLPKDFKAVIGTSHLPLTSKLFTIDFHYSWRWSGMLCYNSSGS